MQRKRLLLEDYHRPSGFDNSDGDDPHEMIALRQTFCKTVIHHKYIIDLYCGVIECYLFR